mgnify:CR=1 FL=1
MGKKKKRVWLWLLILLAALGAAVLAWMGVQYYIILRSRTPEVEYDPGVWFELAPEGAICSDGEPLSTRMRVGTENKVIVFFYGGGISLNDYTAARPYLGTLIDREPGFYSAEEEDQLATYSGLGIASRQQNNPFRDWSVVIIPYTTADFHIGTSDYAYTALDGTESVLHHHGYENFHALMDAAMAYLDEGPEELLVAGWSAGGYGAAILAEELMTDYFPGAGHTTVCVDSSLLILDDWPAVARDVWGAPEHIVEKMKTENLVVDFFTDLYETYGDSVTCLYVGSVRDGALAKYQSYFDTGRYAATNGVIWVYTGYLRVMVEQLRENIPSIGIYLFDRLPYSFNPFLSRLTQHTILETQTAFWRLTAGRSAVQWLYSAVEGDVQTVGLEKLR